MFHRNFPICEILSGQRMLSPLKPTKVVREHLNSRYILQRLYSRDKRDGSTYRKPREKEKVEASKNVPASGGKTRTFSKPDSVSPIDEIVKEARVYCPSTTAGRQLLTNPSLTKGLAFTIKERQMLGIHGQIPPAVRSLDHQIRVIKENLAELHHPLLKFYFLNDLQNYNEKLFFKLLANNVTELLPIVYTPVIGLSCLLYGRLYRRPKGLFITIKDKGHIMDILHSWPEGYIRCVCVTDGGRILGLGDLGCHGMPIPIGKLSLYTAFAAISPQQCLAVLLDVGTNNQKLLKDPNYLGLRIPRTTGDEYMEFIDEFMKSCIKCYGREVLIQFEDFNGEMAFKILDKYRDHFCCFNDDIQGTAAVVVAGLLATTRITKKKFSENTILFLGAGGAATGIAELCCMAMMQDGGYGIDEAAKRIWMVDHIGLVTKERNLTGHLKKFGKDVPPKKSLIEAVELCKPSILIGVAGAGRLFTPEVIARMAGLNERPVIFALSNPTDKAECTAEDAYTHSDGRALFASGSPFPEFTYKGKKYKSGQGNNAYIFPGIALGAISTKMRSITDEIFLEAAKALVDLITEEEVAGERLYPQLEKVQEWSIRIAVRVGELGYKLGLAREYPKPVNLEHFIRSHTFSFEYSSDLNAEYEIHGAEDIKYQN